MTHVPTTLTDADFAVGRNFRKSLLVHQARADQILVSPDLERLADLRWAGNFTETDPAPNAPKGRVSFRNHKNQPLHTNEAGVLAVIRTVSEAWPLSLDFDTLLERARPALPQSDDDAGARKTVLNALQTLFRLNMLRYTLESSPYDTGAASTRGESDAPTLIPGFQAIFEARRDPSFGVGAFNLWHESVNLQLKEAEAWLLPRIDGRHSRKQLATMLRDALSQGTVPDNDGRSLKGQRNLDQKAATMVKKLLELLQRQALLR